MMGQGIMEAEEDMGIVVEGEGEEEEFQNFFPTRLISKPQRQFKMCFVMTVIKWELKGDMRGAQIGSRVTLLPQNILPLQLLGTWKPHITLQRFSLLPQSFLQFLHLLGTCNWGQTLPPLILLPQLLHTFLQILPGSHHQSIEVRAYFQILQEVCEDQRIGIRIPEHML